MFGAANTGGDLDSNIQYELYADELDGGHQIHTLLATLPYNQVTYTHTGPDIKSGQTFKYLMYVKNRGAFRSDPYNFTTTVGA